MDLDELCFDGPHLHYHFRCPFTILDDSEEEYIEDEVDSWFVDPRAASESDKPVPQEPDLFTIEMQMKADEELARCVPIHSTPLSVIMAPQCSAS